MASSARIEELTKKFEENPRRYFAPLANEYRKSGDLAQAISICRAHLPQQPGHMSGHVVFGQALFESGELDESKSVFETALQLDPENLIALRYLGDIALQKGDRTGARQWYQRVLDADPRNEEIQTLLAEVDGMRTPISVPAADATSERSDDWSAQETAMTAAPEMPPAVLDATAELEKSDDLLLDDFTTPGEERSDIGTTDFEATSLVEMVGTGRDDVGARRDVETSVLGGFEPMELQPSEPVAPLLDLERDEMSFEAGAAANSPPALSFEDEPGDSAPLQVGAVDEHAVGADRNDEPSAGVPGLLSGDALLDFSPGAKTTPASDSSIDTVPSERASIDLVEEVPTASAGFVTETMAELYLRQGHREAALDVYRQLLEQNPDDARLRARLDELDRTGEPSIRSFLAGIASRRPRSAQYDSRDAVAAPSGEWVAVPSDTVGDVSASSVPVEVMGWQESSDVVAEIPLASAGEAGVLPGEMPPALLDAIDELSSSDQATDATNAPGQSTNMAWGQETSARRTPAFALDESAVELDLPSPSYGSATTTSSVSSHNESPSLDALFGNVSPSDADAAAASTLAEAFAPVTQDTPLAGRPAVPARDELSLDRVFRPEEQEPSRSGGFSFDQFFGSRTPHAGSATVPPLSGTPPTGARPSAPTPGSTPSPADPEDIEQFNSWLQGLKKR